MKMKWKIILLATLHGGTLLVAQLVEAPCYKPEGRRFGPRWCDWKFSLT
jgi:hypothetical protein